MEEDLCFPQSVFSEYMDDYNYSQGFYITPTRDGSVLVGCIRPVGENSDVYNSRAERATKFAVEEHNNKNKKGSHLKFVKIVNLNVEPTAGMIYYVTFAAAADDEICHYQVKIWEKLNSGYQVQVFRRAPYWIKSSDKLGNDLCCVGINNLMPWMDESYIYYKCFFRFFKEILGVEIIEKEKGGDSKAILWFKNYEDCEKVLKTREGKMMPRTKNFFDFDLSTCRSSTNFHLDKAFNDVSDPCRIYL